MIKKILKGITLGLALAALVQTTLFQTTLHANDVSTYAQRDANVYAVSPVISDNATTRKFMITNYTSETIIVEYTTETDVTPRNVSVAANANEFVVVNVGSGTSVRLFTNANDSYATTNSYDAYNVPVNYYANGQLIYQTTTIATVANGAAWTAPKTTTANGSSYNIAGNNYKTVSFGAAEISFQYTVEMKTPFKSYVNYVDESGTRLNSEKSISFVVTDAGGGFTPQATYIAANGNSYSLLAGQSNILQSYEDGSQTFTYRFQKNDVSKPYLITIIYKNTEGEVLETKTLSVSKTQAVSFKTANTVVDANGIEYTRSKNEAAVINHEYTNPNRTYTVVYNVVEATKPYDITIQYVDLLTGKTLSTTTKNVGVDKTVRFKANASIKQNDVTYVLSKNQTADITHAFGTGQRIYTVYYNEKDKDVTNYKISVMFFDVTNNKVISHVEQEAIMGAENKILVPSNYTFKNTEYVLLSGQGDTTFNFYSTRRNYVFFYRDINDLANEDTVVETTPDGGLNVINPNARNPIIDVDQDGTITIPNVGPNGEDLVVDDQDKVIVKDNETAKGKGTKSDSYTADYIGAAVIAIISLFLLMLFLKNRKNKKSIAE